MKKEEMDNLVGTQVHELHNKKNKIEILSKSELVSKSELGKGPESQQALGAPIYIPPPPSQSQSASNASALLANSSASLVPALQTLNVPAKSTTRSGNYEKIREYKSNAIKGLYDYWVSLFIQIFNSFSMLSLQLEKNQKETIDTIKSTAAATVEAVNISAKESIKNARKESDRVILAQKTELAVLKKRLAEQNQALSEQHEILDFLQQEELARKFAQERAKEKALHRRMRPRKTVRDAASAPELYAFLDAVFNYGYRSEFARSRDVVAGLLLYTTGLRVSNLLHFRIKDLNILLKAEESERVLQVALIKGADQEQSIPISNIYYEMYKDYVADFRALQEGKDYNDLVFTAEGSQTPLERSWLTKRINKHLEVAGKRLNKKLSTHSWRIGHVNALIEAIGIEQAMHLVGHKNIQTTQVYSRQKLNKRETLQVLTRLHLLKQMHAKAKAKRDAC